MPKMASGSRASGACRAISSHGATTNAAPPFPSLRTRSEDELRAFLIAPHPPMPNFNLPREQIDDFVAHIRSIPAN